MNTGEEFRVRGNMENGREDYLRGLDEGKRTGFYDGILFNGYLASFDTFAIVANRNLARGLNMDIIPNIIVCMNYLLEESNKLLKEYSVADCNLSSRTEQLKNLESKSSEILSKIKL